MIFERVSCHMIDFREENRDLNAFRTRNICSLFFIMPHPNCRVAFSFWVLCIHIHMTCYLLLYLYNIRSNTIVFLNNFTAIIDISTFCSKILCQQMWKPTRIQVPHIKILCMQVILIYNMLHLF